jgi:hypothetical protein
VPRRSGVAKRPGKQHAPEVFDVSQLHDLALPHTRQAGMDGMADIGSGNQVGHGYYATIA